MYSLGIEFSTQSVKLIILNIQSGDIHYKASFDYDSNFPNYQTQGGVLQHDNPAIRHSSPFMLTEALDYAFAKMHQDAVDLSLVQAIKTDAMQHCTVYTNSNFSKCIANLDPNKNLIDLLAEKEEQG